MKRKEEALCLFQQIYINAVHIFKKREPLIAVHILKKKEPLIADFHFYI